MCVCGICACEGVDVWWYTDRLQCMEVDSLACFPQPNLHIQVTIVIVDDNDNTPQFSNITLPIEVVEGLATSTVIGFVSASDPDEGINGTVNYRIEQHSSTGV